MGSLVESWSLNPDGLESIGTDSQSLMVSRPVAVRSRLFPRSGWMPPE